MNRKKQILTNKKKSWLTVLSEFSSGKREKNRGDPILSSFWSKSLVFFPDKDMPSFMPRRANFINSSKLLDFPLA